MAASPRDQKPLDYEREEDAILSVVTPLAGARIFVGEMGSLAELTDLIRKMQPQIVHLSGHGKLLDSGIGTFCFEDERGQTDQKSAADLVPVLRQSGVQCVFLNGCETAQADVAGFCQSLVRAGLPLAVGWAAPVADDLATVFAETFYREIGAGEPVPAAMALARLKIQQEGYQPGSGSVAEPDAQDATFVLPQLYCAAPVNLLFDRALPEEDYRGPETRYETLPHGVVGLRHGFIGRRREQQTLIPALRDGQITMVVLTGIGGQGKSTLCTRVANRLEVSGFQIVCARFKRQTTHGVEESAAECGSRVVQVLLEDLRLAFLSGGDPAQRAATHIFGNPDFDDATQLQLAVGFLNDLKCDVHLLIVLDNLEDALDFETRQIADPALAAFYRQLTSGLRRGSRAFITSRYIPHGTPRDDPSVHVSEALGDFEEHQVLKFFSRDAEVTRRIRNRELPMAVVQKAIPLVGGTPRFLDVVRSLLRNFNAEELNEELDALAKGWDQVSRDTGDPGDEGAAAGTAVGTGKLEAARDTYVTGILGPKLFARMSEPARRLLSRLSLSQLPLPADGLSQILQADPTPAAAEDGQNLPDAITLAQDYGLLTQLTGDDSPTLYHTPLLWRGWLTHPDRLPRDAALAVHRALAEFWKDAYERDRERELQVSIVSELESCRLHAEAAESLEVFRWSSLRLSQFHHRYSRFREARRLMEQLRTFITERHLPIAEFDVFCLHHLARVEESLSNWGAARDLYKSALQCDFSDSDADQSERAVILCNLAGIDVNQGEYEKARDSYEKAQKSLKQIGDRVGEAATWHQLATIDLNEGKYDSAREKFGRALDIKQQIGNRAGEAATLYQISVVAWQRQRYRPSAMLTAVALQILASIGSADAETVARNFQVDCRQLELDEAGIKQLVQEAAAEFAKDRGHSLVDEAFA